jgi:phosphorylcholine metabolism protein LicD
MGNSFTSERDYSGHVLPGETYYLDSVLHKPITGLTNKTEKISDHLAHRLKNMYIDLRDILDNNDIKHWAAYGTLLGAFRHEGIIPWDDDFDIEIESKDVQKLITLFNDNKKYILVKPKFSNWCFFKLFYIESNDMRPPFIDIFFDQQINNNQFSNCTNPQMKLDYQDIFPLKKTKFEDTWIYIPNKAEYILKKYYGEDVFTIPKNTHNHKLTFLERGNIIAPSPYIGKEFFGL